MKQPTSRSFRVLSLPAMVLLVLSSCVTGTPEGDFAAENAASISTFTLSNGIPVVVKQNPDNRIYHLRLVLKGGSALVDAGKAGIEGIMLASMARGSMGHPYESLMAELDATSASISSGAGFDAASYSLNTLDKYFDRVLPLWIDTLVNPAFAAEDVDQVLSNARESLEGAEQDAWSKLAREMNKVFFKGHPYSAPFDGTQESLAAMDEASIREWYRTRFSTNRMVVVAVGNFRIADLRDKLERGLGGLKNLGTALPPTPAFGSEAAVSSNPGGLTVVDYPQAKGIAYLRGDFPLPPPSHPDWAAAQIGFKMLRDLLFEVVRTRHSAVYSPGANVRSFAANYGSITIFKTTKASAMKSYIDEALAPLLQGKCLSTAHKGEGSGDSLPLEPVASALPLYVEQYINEVYEAQQTNASIAAQIEQSLLHHDDPRAWLGTIARFRSVKAEDVVRVVRSALVDGPVTWGILGDKAAVAGVKAEDYAFPAGGR